MDTKAIDWSPLVSGGSNFKTHKLVAVSPMRMEYKPGIGIILLGVLFVVVGLGVSSFVFLEETSFMIFFLGLVFLAPGVFVIYSAFKPIVFDKTEGYFWKGKTAPSQVADINELKTVAKLDDIYGIQVVKEYVRSSNDGKNTSYYSYEINLVLQNGQRINVIDYGHATSILQDASRLAKFINKPVLSPPKTV